MQTNRRRLFTFSAATTAPTQDDIIRIIITAYPECFHGSISLSIIKEAISVPVSIVTTAARTPTASPDGIVDAVPVTFRLTVISPLPFPYILSGRGQKKNRDRILSRFFISNQTSISGAFLGSGRFSSGCS